MPDNDEILEMLDYGIEMLTGELPLVEQEYGWTPELQAGIRGRLAELRETIAGGKEIAAPAFSEELDSASVKEGTLREFLGMIETTVEG